MKKTPISLLFCAGLLTIMSACNNAESEKKDSVEHAEAMNEHKEEAQTNVVAEDDAEFAVFTANAGMTEIEAAKLAQSKAASQGVKDYAAMMIKDHEAAAAQLKSIAATKQITLPQTIGDDQQKALADLGKKTGKDFDKAYMSMMVDDHSKVVDKFKKEADNSKDAALKNFATATLPTLNMHLEHAKTTKDNLK